jgi:hypothetical protein
MKKYMVLFAALFFMLTAAVYAAPKLNVIATVSSIVGDVQIQKGGQGAWSPAKEGSVVGSGDRIKTGPESSCVLKWNRDNVMKLTAFTNLAVDKLEKNPAAGAENSSMDLWSGKVYAKAKKLSGPQSSFEVKTPAAIAGVRGTEMSVGMGADDTTNVECLNGMVSVKGRAGGEVLLKTKEKTTIKKDAQPEPPKQLDPADEQGFDQLKDSVGASLDIIQPSGDLETDKSPILVKGMTEPGGTVTVNGQPVTADDKGGFSAPVNLQEGDNKIKIEASGTKGSSKSVERNVKFKPAPAGGDHEEPIGLKIINPNDGFVTRESSISISGTAKPGTDISVNGIPAASSPGSSSFSVMTTLVEGVNQITVTGKKGENTQSVSITVTKDSMPPRLMITQPSGDSFDVSGENGCVLAGDSIECTIIGQTESGVTLIINGMRTQVEQDGSFSSVVRIPLNATMINIAAADPAGNRATVILSRKIDQNKIAYIEIMVSPETIVANRVDTATISIKTLNFLKQPIDASVMLNATYGGTLSTSVVSTTGGMATAVFSAGVGGNAPNVVTITARSGIVFADARLTLLPDVPPKH